MGIREKLAAKRSVSLPFTFSKPSGPSVYENAGEDETLNPWVYPNGPREFRNSQADGLCAWLTKRFAGWLKKS
jgi:hypothetical protein